MEFGSFYAHGFDVDFCLFQELFVAQGGRLLIMGEGTLRFKATLTVALFDQVTHGLGWGMLLGCRIARNLRL